MGLRAIPIDEFFAQVEETRERRYGPANPNDEKFLRRIREEDARRKNMAEGTCKIDGCEKPKYKSNAVCYEHFRERQKEQSRANRARKQTQGGETPRRVEPTTATNPPAIVTVDGERKVVDVETLLDAFDKVQDRRRAIFVERQNQHGSLSINECGLDDLSGVLKLKVARVKQQVRAGINDSEVLLDSLADLANYCAIMELKHTGEWELPWEEA